MKEVQKIKHNYSEVALIGIVLGILSAPIWIEKDHSIALGMLFFSLAIISLFLYFFFRSELYEATFYEDFIRIKYIWKVLEFDLEYELIKEVLYNKHIYRLGSMLVFYVSSNTNEKKKFTFKYHESGNSILDFLKSKGVVIKSL